MKNILLGVLAILVIAVSMGCVDNEASTSTPVPSTPEPTMSSGSIDKLDIDKHYPLVVDIFDDVMPLSFILNENGTGEIIWRAGNLSDSVFEVTIGGELVEGDTEITWVDEREYGTWETTDLSANSITYNFTYEIANAEEEWSIVLTIYANHTAVMHPGDIYETWGTWNRKWKEQI